MPEPLFHLWARLAGWVSAGDERLAAVAAAVLLPCGVYLLASGLDDLTMDGAWLWRRLRGRRHAAPEALVQQRIAVWIPLWQESGVIGRMLRDNLERNRYPLCEVFAGVYRNDPETRAEVERAAKHYGNLHLVVTPHDGPTSKADCLNQIHAGMLDWEWEQGWRADVVVVHDAEDVIHADSFTEINRHIEGADMVQMPVLPLATGLREWTHGLYCDDFAESQNKDMETRVALGGFLPGCGVGTALRREALDKLAAAGDGTVFSADALTEDYDLGLRMHKLGFRQRMIPMRWQDGAPVATREYFPRNQMAAVRQRTRWVTGNALQAWERHGWGAGSDRRWRQAWFLWRDRKGLWGNALSVICNGLFLWGMASWAASWIAGTESALGHALQRNAALRLLAGINMALLAERIGVRAAVSGRIYGWRFALGVPLRMLWGNWINARASARALGVWMAAKLLERPLLWLKTDHSYPLAEEGTGPTPNLARAAAAGAGLYGTQASEPLEEAEWASGPAMRLRGGRSSLEEAAAESSPAGKGAPAPFRRWGERRSRLPERRQPRSGPGVA